MLTRWNLYIIETVSWFIVGPVSISSINIIYVIRWHISAVVWPVQNCDSIAWLEEITAKRIFTRFQLWAHKFSVKWVIGLRQSQFGCLAIASSLRSPSLEGKMRAAMGATGECHIWHVFISISDIKRCGIIYLSFYCGWWSCSKVNNTEFSDMPLNKLPADKTSTEVLFENFTMKSYGNLV